MKNETFGNLIKRKRLEMNIGLRKFAQMLDLSPAFISKMENNEYKPPKEENIIKMAQILKIDKDILLALANKVSSDIEKIIIQEPEKYATFLRKVNNKNDDIWTKINNILNNE